MSRPGDLRASDADRDRIVERLHKAATEGRIAAEELEQRVTTALRARTYSELERTVSDLPVRREGRAPVRRSSAGWALSAIRANPMLLLFVIPALAVTAAMLLAATIVWGVLMIVIMVMGGHSRRPHPPWMYTRHRRPLPSRRGPGSYWA